MGCGGSTGELTTSIISVLDLLEGEALAAAMDDVRPLSDALMDYGHEELEEHLNELEGEL